MFNKSNLFHKTADTPTTRTTQRPIGSTGTTGGVLAAAEPASTVVPTSSESSHTPAAAVERATPAAASEVTSESRLIVGPDVKLKGAEILDCDTLVVEGRVEATMDSRVLRIAEKGAYKGTVGIDIAEIHGHFEGELTARQQLLIHATGRVSGKIRYGKILIEEGGELSGDVQSLNNATKEGLRAVDSKSQETRPLTAVAG
jgi:cytoskeletal protein CcmA (bactofilin family)